MLGYASGSSKVDPRRRQSTVTRRMSWSMHSAMSQDPAHRPLPTLSPWACLECMAHDRDISMAVKLPSVHLRLIHESMDLPSVSSYSLSAASSLQYSAEYPKFISMIVLGPSSTLLTRKLYFGINSQHLHPSSIEHSASASIQHLYAYTCADYSDEANASSAQSGASRSVFGVPLSRLAFMLHPDDDGNPDSVLLLAASTAQLAFDLSFRKGECFTSFIFSHTLLD